MLPFTSLENASAVGPGASNDLEGSYDHHTMVIVTTGGASWTVQMEGSHDGISWFTLMPPFTSSGNTVVSLTTPGTTAPGHLVRYVRANLTAFSGGTSTVSVTIASSTTEKD